MEYRRAAADHVARPHSHPMSRAARGWFSNRSSAIISAIMASTFELRSGASILQPRGLERAMALAACWRSTGSSGSTSL
jgi:hypothetical protein